MSRKEIIRSAILCGEMGVAIILVGIGVQNSVIAPVIIGFILAGVALASTFLGDKW